MTEQLDMHPGCYGMGTPFNPNEAICATCPFMASCGPLSQERYLTLCAKLNVKPRNLERMKVKTPPIVRPDALIGVSKKSESLLERIESAARRGGASKIIEKLRARINPFDVKPVFLRVACHLLLHLPNGITRAHLKVAFEKKLNWSPGTAASHVTQTFQVLCALGAAVEIDGRLTLKA